MHSKIELVIEEIQALAKQKSSQSMKQNGDNLNEKVSKLGIKKEIWSLESVNHIEEDEFSFLYDWAKLVQLLHHIDMDMIRQLSHMGGANH